MGKTKIYEEIKVGIFPRCIKIGRTSVWVESEIDAWIQQKVHQSRHKARPQVKGPKKTDY